MPKIIIKIVIPILALFLFEGLSFSPNLSTAIAAESQSLVGLPSLAPVVSKAAPAVVNIFTVKVVKSRPRNFGGGQQFRSDPYEEFFDQFFGFPKGGTMQRDRKEKAQGSGFIFDPSGYIITNNHVVDGADEIKVKLADEQEITAEIIGRDPKTDLALIKLTKAGTYPYISLGDSDALNIGDWLVAIGNPFGLEHTVTLGILSARSRAIGAGPYDDYLQTDASINPGNSGGPLLNLQGEVVGINTMIIAGGTGIGFAIPANMAREIINTLKDKGQVTRGWLGVMIQQVTPELANSFGKQEAAGALVSDLLPNAPALEAGIVKGDIIVSFDGHPIISWQELPALVAKTEVGKKVDVVVYRDKKELTVSVKMGKLEDETGDANGSPVDLGLTLREITPDLSRRLGLEVTAGILVENVNPDSVAAEAGIQARDIILEIDRKSIKDVHDYQEAIKSHPKDTPVLVFLKRGSMTIYCTFSL